MNTIQNVPDREIERLKINLHEAINGSYIGIKKVVREIKNVNSEESFLKTIMNSEYKGKTALRAAYDYVDKVKLLVDEGADIIDVNEDEKWNAFHVALRYGKASFVESALEEEENRKNLLFSHTYEGYTAFHIAAVHENTDILKVLFSKLKPEEDLPKSLHNQELPILSFAISNNASADILKFLLDQKKIDVREKQKGGLNAFMAAVFYTNYKAVNFLINYKPEGSQKGIGELFINELTDSGSTALHLVVRKSGKEKNFENEPLNIKRSQMIHLCDKLEQECIALAQDRVPILEALLGVPGIKVNEENKRGETPLSTAIDENRINILEALLKAPGLRVNEKDKEGNTFLHKAVKKFKAKMVKVLLTSPDIELNTENNHKKTPMDEAIDLNCMEFVKIFENKIFQNNTDIETYYKYYLVNEKTIKHSSPKKIKYLIDKGADVNVKDVGDRTPLHYAVIYKRTDILKLLIENGADIKVKDENCSTLLHFAVRVKNVQTVRALLAIEGMKINEKSTRGHTPLDEALGDGLKEIAEILQKRIAQDLERTQQKTFTEVEKARRDFQSEMYYGK